MKSRTSRLMADFALLTAQIELLLSSLPVFEEIDKPMLAVCDAAYTEYLNLRKAFHRWLIVFDRNIVEVKEERTLLVGAVGKTITAVKAFKDELLKHSHLVNNESVIQKHFAAFLSLIKKFSQSMGAELAKNDQSQEKERGWIYDSKGDARVVKTITAEDYICSRIISDCRNIMRLIMFGFLQDSKPETTELMECFLHLCKYLSVLVPTKLRREFIWASSSSSYSICKQVFFPPNANPAQYDQEQCQEFFTKLIIDHPRLQKALSDAIQAEMKSAPADSSKPSNSK